MKYLIPEICIILLVLLSCQEPSGKKIKDGIAYEYYSDGMIKSETEVKDTLAHGLKKEYDRDGNLISAYTFTLGRLNGPAVTYYPNGKLKQKMYYRDGLREGNTEMFYNTGELYRVTPFVNGKLNGIRKMYYKDGTLMAEAPYKDNMPGTGLKEYNSKGEFEKDNTRILIREDNRLFAEGHFTLYISLSKPKPATKYFLGDLIDGKYIGINSWELPVRDGEGYYTIILEKGRFRMETLIFTAVYKTGKSNLNVISRKYNLAIDNK